MLLDASGSMSNIRQATVAGINSFIQEQTAANTGHEHHEIDLSPDLTGGPTLSCNLTLAAFASGNYGNIMSNNGEPTDIDYSYTVIYNNVPIQDTNSSWSNQYATSGGTPLLDAACKCIDDTKKQIAALPEAQKPGRVIFVLITDGEENTSKKFKKADLTQRIQEQTDNEHWQFIFLGANQDAIQEGADSGVAVNNSMTYAANDAGVLRAFASTSSMVTAKRYTHNAADMSNVGYAISDYASQDQLLGSAVNMRHFSGSNNTAGTPMNIAQGVAIPENKKP